MKYLKPVHFIVGFLRAFILPYNYRSLFMGKIKVAVYLHGGTILYIKCSKYTITLGDETAKYNFSDFQEQFKIKPTHIEAIRVVDWFR